MNTKAIRNYEESYTVSENGTVTSIKTGRVLKQELIKRSNTNYRRVTLCKDGKATRFQVHQLVAIHFINNPEDKQHINHIENDYSLYVCHLYKNRSRMRFTGSTGQCGPAKRSAAPRLRNFLTLIPIF